MKKRRFHIFFINFKNFNQYHTVTGRPPQVHKSLTFSNLELVHLSFSTYYDFFNRSHKYHKIECFESSGWQIECFESQIECFESWTVLSHVEWTFPMFSVFSQLTSCSPIRDDRTPQFVETWSQHHLSSPLLWCTFHQNVNLKGWHGSFNFMNL